METLQNCIIGKIKLLNEVKRSGQIWIDGKDTDCILFAAQELCHYLKAVYAYTFTIGKGTCPAGATGIIILRFLNVETNDNFYDEFHIAAENGNVIISGVNDRSVLFGAYKFMEEYIGIKWPQPGLEIIPERRNDTISVSNKIYIPDIKKRGFSFNLSGWELINTNVGLYLENMIVWMTRNYCNTIYVQFDIWVKHKNALAGIIKKRNLELVLNGHNFIDLFLPPEKYFDRHKEWFALNDKERVISQQCFSNEEGVKKAIDNIIEYLKEQAIIEINAVSLWPNENIPCQCCKCSQRGFMETFSTFIEKMKDSINLEKLPIRNFEIIAYNASLKWEMLEDIPGRNETDVLIACWGRDYEFSIANPLNSNDLRFKKTIENWSKVYNNNFHSKLTVLEYYGTYWMMSSLFPSLNRVICEDMVYYNKLNVLGVIFLILPYELQVKYIWEVILKSKACNNYKDIEFNSESTILSVNMHMYTRKAFDISSSCRTLMDEYCNLVYGEYSAHAKEIYENLENNIALLTEYNCILYSLRFFDVWYLDSPLKLKMESTKQLIPLSVRKWNMNDDAGVSLERAKICARIIKNMDKLYMTSKNAIYESDDLHSRNIMELTGYFKYVYLKIKSLYHQSLSQIGIIQHDYVDALKNLEAARELESRINGINLDDINYWISYINEKN